MGLSHTRGYFSFVEMTIATLEAGSVVWSGFFHSLLGDRGHPLSHLLESSPWMLICLLSRPGTQV